MATSVVLAALSIPPYEAPRGESEAELVRDRSMRMAHILGFPAVSLRCFWALILLKSQCVYDHASSLAHMFDRSQGRGWN